MSAPATPTTAVTHLPHHMEPGPPTMGAWSFKVLGMVTFVMADGIHLSEVGGQRPRLVAAMGCPECGELHLLDKYHIHAGGLVTPTFVCRSCATSTDLVLMTWPGTPFNGHDPSEAL